MNLELPVADHIELGERPKMIETEETFVIDLGRGFDERSYNVIIHYSRGLGYWFCTLIGVEQRICETYGEPQPKLEVTTYFHCTQDQLRVRLAELGL